MKLRWHAGNALRLLENGEAFYPEVLQAIAAARVEILIETFILFDDVVGRRLQAALIDAARRGVRVDVTVDDYGTPDLPQSFVDALTTAGVRLHVFDPRPRLLGIRFNLIQRLHRKIVVVDGDLAFIGGINFSEDHLIASGPMAKQDYAVSVRGPVVADIHRDALLTVAPARRRLRGVMGRHAPAPQALPAPPPVTTGEGAVAAFVKRDNGMHRDDIERCYRLAIRTAEREVLIANAYFFPGYLLLREMRRAARRGVQVSLILQGQPDMAYVRTVARLLYQSLAKDGVNIFEYHQRPLHGKVAVIDDAWVTVGSSNLDPLSLALNLEANVVARDPALAADLRQRLHALRDEHCKPVTQADLPQYTMWRYLLGAVIFHVVRGFPAWLRHLPRPRVRLRSFVRPTLVVDTMVQAARPTPEGPR